MKSTNHRRGFTLVEIMIVVMTIGILMAIAVPNMVKARSNSQKGACVANMKRIESAKEQWAMENGQAANATPTSGNLSPNYLKTYPSCPTAGTYTIGDMSTRPTCSNGASASHVLQ